VEESEKKVFSIFFDSSKRPKITPRHESAIMVMLEGSYAQWRVKTALEKLEESGHLVSIKKEIQDVGEARFYFLSHYGDGSSIEKIQKKIDVSSSWIKKYSDNEITDMLGGHLHDVVRAELRAQGFEIKAEKTKKYLDTEWPKSNQTIDIIAKHKTRNLAIGVEIKNTLSLVPISEISEKIKICKHLGITPVFACRWLEPHRDEIENNGGFLWQFKKQLYPKGQKKFVETIRKRFKFPVEVNSELPTTAVKEFEKWIEKF
jgi:hypothetical protein